MESPKEKGVWGKPELEMVGSQGAEGQNHHHVTVTVEDEEDK